MKIKKYTILIMFALFFGLQDISLGHEGHSHEKHSHEDHHVNTNKKYTFIVGNYMTSSIIGAIKTIWQEYPFIKDRITFELISKTDLDSGFNPIEIEDSDIIVIDIMSIKISTSTQSGFDQNVIKMLLLMALIYYPSINQVVLTHSILTLDSIMTKFFVHIFNLEELITLKI